MMQLKKLVFNPFQVNTYILFDQTNECVIIDPACDDPYEEEELVDFIRDNNLKPVHLLITHAHIDHILGNAFAAETFNLPLAAHPDSTQYLRGAKEYARTFGFKLEKVCYPSVDLYDGQLIRFGESELEVLHTPGHAHGSVCFYAKKEDILISGDVLFYQSIGRTDLDGGDYDVLKRSIWEKLFILPDETIVYPGHGPETSIGNEKVTNPFVAIG